MKKYELWESEKEQSYTMLPEETIDRSMLEEDATLLRTFEALSFSDACEQQAKFLGWDKEPIEDKVVNG